ncbi:unnamed protein product [Clonostachys byssicola]|uniref:Xylanolytic transcriptional activator regulatory domain-containing protein n=1 Tax=Clonostachys byssicola TaxID=160290 RepID=A0A9N9U3P4_9HYPO|nr:unnamed protein product [Clonostachys byssicola]
MTEYNRGKAHRVSTTTVDQGHGDVASINPTGNECAKPEAVPRQQETPRPSLADSNASCSGRPRSSSEHGNQLSPDALPATVVPVQPSIIPDAMMPDSLALPEVGDMGRSSRNSPEPPHTDLEGHYVGPASGVSFLSRALKKLRDSRHSASTSLPSIFNFADAPTPQFDPHFLILPDKSEAKRLIRYYFEFASPTHRYLHQPTVDIWCDEFYDSIQNHGPLEAGAHEKRAIILALLAVAKQFSPRSESSESTSQDYIDSRGVSRDYADECSAIFFAASDHHLRQESGGIRLTSIQARLVLCFLLLAQSRVNSAWSLFGTVANLVLAIGLHRRKKREGNGGTDLIEHECRKRAFWSAYILDNYLSAGLGRPRSFHEEDLDQELPLCVDDWQITPLKILSNDEGGQSLTQASISHAKHMADDSPRSRLLKIVSGILRDLYGLKRLHPDKQEQTLTLYDTQLTEWRCEIGPFLDITTPKILLPIFRRQHTVLHMAHSHAVIMLHRQALLTKPSALSLRQDNTVQGALPYGVRRCLDAAAVIVAKLRELVKQQQMCNAFWFTHYYVFSALVALYLHVVQSRSKATHTWESYLDLAQQGFRDLKTCAADMSYAQRYVVVLTELQNEATKPLEEHTRPAAVLQGVQLVAGQQPAVSGAILNNIEQAAATHGILGTDDITSQEFPPLSGLGLDAPQQFTFPDPPNIYNGVSDPSTTLVLENQDDFNSLELEGLADLAFMFLAEENRF